MGWFKHLGLNKLLFGLILYYGLKQVLLFGFFLLLWALLFGLFIFWYNKLGLLNQGVHNFYLRVFTILFKLRTSI
jgi:uncharacterized membrane protein